MQGGGRKKGENGFNFQPLLIHLMVRINFHKCHCPSQLGSLSATIVPLDGDGQNPLLYMPMYMDKLSSTLGLVNTSHYVLTF